MRLLPALGIVVVALVAWWFLSEEGGGPQLPAAANEKAAPVAEAPEPTPAPQAEIAAPVAERTDANAPTQHDRSLLSRLFGKVEPKPAPPAPEPAKVVFDGVVIVTDSRGREHPDESGTLLPAFFQEPKATEFAHRTGEAIDVVAGRFHAEITSGEFLGAERLVLAGRRVALDGEPVAVEAGQLVTLRGHWIEPTKLRVIDATTKADLHDVTVARGHGWLGEGSARPGRLAPGDVVVERGLSPVELFPATGSEDEWRTSRFWVGAAGHVWSQIELDLMKPAEVVVELATSATLVVLVSGELPKPIPSAPPSADGAAATRIAADPEEHSRSRAPVLRVRQPQTVSGFDEAVQKAIENYDELPASQFPGGVKPTLQEFRSMAESMREEYEARETLGPLLLELPATLGESRVDGLAAGDVIVTVELGKSYDAPLVAGSASATLVAGESTRVKLELAALPPPPGPASLAGTLFVPKSWSGKSLELQFTPVNLRGKSDADQHRIALDEMAPIAGRAGWHRWSASSVRPARYRVVIPETGFVTDVDVPPLGRQDVELVLPEAAQIHVVFVDLESGRPVELENARWQPERPGSPFMSEGSLELEKEGPLVRCGALVPIGRGYVVPWGMNDEWDLASESTMKEVRPGDQEFTIRVQHATGLVVGLACDGTAVEFPDDAIFEVKIESVGHAGTLTQQGGDASSSCRMKLSAPGRYKVTLPAIPGYAPVEPFELEIPAGGFLKHTVALRRN